MKLYFLTGSLHSKNAVDLIEKCQLKIEIIDASETHFLAALYEEQGIKELPCLVGEYQRYTGLAEIKEYVSSLQKNSIDR